MVRAARGDRNWPRWYEYHGAMYDNSTNGTDQKIADRSQPGPPLEEDKLDGIRSAVKFVQEKTANELSEITHEEYTRRSRLGERDFYSYESETPAFSICLSITIVLALNSRLSDSTLVESARDPETRAKRARRGAISSAANALDAF